MDARVKPAHDEINFAMTTPWFAPMHGIDEAGAMNDCPAEFEPEPPFDDDRHCIHRVFETPRQNR